MSDKLKSLAWYRSLSKPIPQQPKPIRITLRLLWEVLPMVWRKFQVWRIMPHHIFMH